MFIVFIIVEQNALQFGVEAMTALASSGVSETITLASFPSKLLFRARNAREVALFFSSPS